MQTDETLLANNSQHCWMLHVASVCTPCCMLLDVVAQSLKPVKLFSQQLPTFVLFRDRRSVAQQCWIRCTALPTLLGPRTLITHGLQRLMGCILCHDALQVPALLGLSCCIRLHTTANMHATTPNIVGATMLGVVASVCTQP